MRRIQYTLLILAIASCETVVEIDIPEVARVPVIQSVANPDSVWSAYVSYSQSILDTTRYPPIANAAVSIKDASGIIVSTLTYRSDGIYRSNEKPQAGRDYQMVVDIPGFERITAEAHVPQAPIIVDGSIQISMVNGYAQGLFYAAFEDDASTSNYYAVTVYVVEELRDGRGELIRYSFSPINIESNDPALNKLLNYQTSLLFTDDLFPNKLIALRLKPADARFFVPGRGTAICIKEVSEDYYRYASTLNLQRKTDQDPLSQPVDVKGNINNGLGVFGAYAQSNYTVLQPTPKITSINPTQGRAGDVVTITGENLYNGPGATSVYFLTSDDGTIRSVGQNGGFTPAFTPILNTTVNSITVAVPQKAKSNRIMLTTNGSTTFSEVFTIVE